MERKSLKLGEKYGWKSYRYAPFREATLISLEPLTIRYEETSFMMSGISRVEVREREVRSRELLCLWSEKEKFLEKEKERNKARGERNHKKRMGRQADIQTLREQLLKAGYTERLPAGFRAPHDQVRGFVISVEMLKRLLATHPEFAEPGEQQSALAELLGGEDASGASVLPPGSE